MELALKLVIAHAKELQRKLDKELHLGANDLTSMLAHRKSAGRQISAPNTILNRRTSK